MEIMPTISVLDETTINKIAAGEVIERPASVVKELLENAIDAQATAVTVEIRDGGCSLIRITDNGCGIPKDQVATAFLRHATSKIHTVDDLMTIGSLGFRGEALASIAAVSQVELISKTTQTLTGTRYQIEGGREKSLEEIGAPEGTTIIARNLFFNTPARKKFLKSPQTEGAYISSLLNLTDNQVGVFIGNAAYQFIEGFDRGGIGAMPGCSMFDLYLKMYNEYIAGDRAGAAWTHTNLILPILNHIRQNVEMIIAFEKRILRKRGIIACDFCREPGFVSDEYYDKLFEEHYAAIEPYFTWRG